MAPFPLHRSVRRARLAAFALLCAGLGLAGLQPAAAQTASAPAAAESTAPAAPEVIPVPPAVQATLDKLTGGKAQILKAFKAPNGLIGLALSLGAGHNTILYASADGAYLFQGAIIDAQGQNLTQAAADTMLPQPPTAAENFAALDKAVTYLWGQDSAKKELWIVFDPNCIYCHKAFEDLKSYVADGTVKVHILQVGFLKPSSLGKAAAILGAKDPVAALTEDETKFDVAQEEGGIAADLSNAEAVAKVKANNAWMDAQGIQGTPYLLFHDTQGKVVGIAGYVQDTAKLIAEIGPKG